MKLTRILSYCLFVISAIALIAISVNQSDISKYQEEGQIVSAEVISKSKEVVKVSKGRSETEYSVWSRINYEGKNVLVLLGNNMTDKQYESLKEGENVEIVYLPGYIYADGEPDADGDIIASVDRDIYLAEYISAGEVEGRRTSYYIFGSVSFLLGLILFFLKKK